MSRKTWFLTVGVLLLPALGLAAFGADERPLPEVRVERPTVEAPSWVEFRGEVARLLGERSRGKARARLEALCLRHRVLLEKDLAQRVQDGRVAGRFLAIVADIPPSADPASMWRETASLSREDAFRRKVTYCLQVVEDWLETGRPIDASTELDLQWLSWHVGDPDDLHVFGASTRLRSSWTKERVAALRSEDLLVQIAHKAGLSKDPHDIPLAELLRRFLCASGYRRRLLHQLLWCCSPPEIPAPAWTSPGPDHGQRVHPQWPCALYEPPGLATAWIDALRGHVEQPDLGHWRLRLAQLFYVDSEAEPEVLWEIAEPLRMGETVTVHNCVRVELPEAVAGWGLTGTWQHPWWSPLPEEIARVRAAGTTEHRSRFRLGWRATGPALEVGEFGSSPEYNSKTGVRQEALGGAIEEGEIGCTVQDSELFSRVEGAVLTLVTLERDEGLATWGEEYWCGALARENAAAVETLEGAGERYKELRSAGEAPGDVPDGTSHWARMLRERLCALLPFLDRPSHCTLSSRLLATLKPSHWPGSMAPHAYCRHWRSVMTREALQAAGQHWTERLHLRGGLPRRTLAAAARACEERGDEVPAWVREELGADERPAVLAAGAGGVALALAMLIFAAIRRRGRPWPAVCVIFLGVLVSSLHAEWNGQSLFLESAGLLLVAAGALLLARAGTGWIRWWTPAIVAGAALLIALYQLRVEPSFTREWAPWLVLIGLLGLPLACGRMREAAGSSAMDFQFGFVISLPVAVFCTLFMWRAGETLNIVTMLLLLLGLLLVAVSKPVEEPKRRRSSPGFLDRLSPSWAFVVIGAILILQQVLIPWGREDHLWGTLRVWLWLFAVLVGLFLATLRTSRQEVRGGTGAESAWHRSASTGGG